MKFFLTLTLDCLMLIVLAILLFEVALPLINRQLVFPFFRKLVNKVSEPKQPKQKEEETKKNQ